jgi:hypothetical protein
MNFPVFHVIFWPLLISLGYTIYYGYWPGILSSSIFLIVTIVLWIYSKFRQTKKERYY